MAGQLQLLSDDTVILSCCSWQSQGGGPCSRVAQLAPAGSPPSAADCAWTVYRVLEIHTNLFRNPGTLRGGVLRIACGTLIEGPGRRVD